MLDGQTETGRGARISFFVFEVDFVSTSDKKRKQLVYVLYQQEKIVDKVQAVLM